jgi:hypothetical protein
VCKRGEIPYGTVDKLVKTYHSNGDKAVTRDNLNYRLKKKKTCTSSIKDSLIGSSVTITNRSIDITSDLTDQTSRLRDISNTASAPNDEAPNTSANVAKVGGRKKGSKTNLVKENEKKKGALVTKCATLFHEAKVNAKKKDTVVPNGMLQKNIDEGSKKSGLSTVSLSLEPVRSRVK